MAMLRKIAGALGFFTALAAVSAYHSTKLLVRAAMDRNEPKLLRYLGARISGVEVPEKLRQLQSVAAEVLKDEDTEYVTICGKDGTLLAGHWYPCPDQKRIVIAMHGWRSSWCSDFGIVAGFLRKSKCGVLFAEQRGQMASGGRYMGFGVTERYDCMDWVSWVTENVSNSLPIYLCGISMGASTVLMASGLNLPTNVHGIIADCGFTSPDEIWKHVADCNLHLHYRLRRVLAAGMYDRLTHIRGFAYSTTEALKKSKTPVLLIHGEKDHFVPVEMTYRNYNACAAPKRLLIVPGAEHGMSYLTDRTRYEEAVTGFWRDFD